MTDVDPSPPVAPVEQPRKRRWLRALSFTAAASVVALGAGWWAIHQFPELAGQTVDLVRDVVGPKPIAVAEDLAYSVQDALDRWRFKDAAPVTYWAPAASGSVELPASPPQADSASPAGSAELPVKPPAVVNPAFPPPVFSPPHPNVALAGDGTWIAMPTPQDPSSQPVMYKALVHPDPRRSYALVAVVAIDLSRAEIVAVPGTREPASETVTRAQRPGKIPVDDHADLLAVFNGGFQAVHGRWGMMSEGLKLLPPRPQGCTVVRYQDGSMRVGVWKSLAETASEMRYFRQTPPCLIEGGVINPAAHAEKNTSWGATVDGDTVIRRSALGLDAERKVAFYGMGDHLSAGSLSKAMRAAGAWDVAQLDVNWTYPRFFLFDGGEVPRIAEQPLAPAQDWKIEDYVTRSIHRDFFYIKRKKPSTAGLARRHVTRGGCFPEVTAPTRAPRARLSCQAAAPGCGSSRPQARPCALGRRRPGRRATC